MKADPWKQSNMDLFKDASRLFLACLGCTIAFLIQKILKSCKSWNISIFILNYIFFLISIDNPKSQFIQQVASFSEAKTNWFETRWHPCRVASAVFAVIVATVSPLSLCSDWSRAREGVPPTDDDDDWLWNPVKTESWGAANEGWGGYR